MKVVSRAWKPSLGLNTQANLYGSFADASCQVHVVQPSGEPCMNDIVKAAYGALDGRALAQYVAAGEQTGDMHLATYDWAADELIVANASPDGTQLAYDAPLVRFSMSALWAQTL